MAKVRLENTPTEWRAVRKPYGWAVFASQRSLFPIALIGTVEKTGDEAAIVKLMAGALAMLEELKLIESGWTVREERAGQPGFVPLNLWERERLGVLREVIAEMETEASDDNGNGQRQPA